MGLRIACDLDGTLADLEGALQREAEQLFGPDVDLGHRTCRRRYSGYHRCPSFGEALDDLQTLMTTTARSGGLVSRLRAAIGI